MDRPIIFYHGSCPDGFGGAYAAWKKFGEDAEYIPLHRGNDPFPSVAGRDVFFIDFVFDKERMDAIASEARTLIALDHHIGVREVTESLPGSIFNNDRSGAGIAWSYFHPDTPFPKLLAHVEDDDLFKFALPDTKAVLAYLNVHPYTFESWDALALGLEDPATSSALLSRMHIYEEYFDLLANYAAEHAKLVSFEGYEVYFATTHPLKTMKSRVGNILARKKGPFALVVSAHPDGYGVSIRGDGSVNVAEIAEKYGGNGHFSSAGFVIGNGGAMPWERIKEDPQS